MCFNENDIKYIPRDNLSKRQKNLCNEELAINRDMLCCILAACLDSRSEPLKCLEGIAVCGIYTMLWKKYLGDDVDLTANGCLEDDYNLITENFKLNGMNIKILNEDPCLLLRKNLYDFIFLNCKTNTSKYLDSLFSNIKDDAVAVITTSEDPSLYWQTAEIAQRCYGGIIAKTSFHREVAVRLVIAEMARAAARYGKGINILCIVGYKPQQSFTIVARIKKGNIEANDCLKNIKKLAYCNMCENREFLSNSYFIDKINTELSCECSKESEGKVTIGIGPLWAGEIFDIGFIEIMLKCSRNFTSQTKVSALLTLILEEARCESKVRSEPPPSKMTKKEKKQTPFFYINTHRHSAKELKLQKVNKIISLLQNNGYRASRTHFDTEAIRTDASVAECLKIFKKHS